MSLPDEIPLFPLDVVLLPHRRLPLHIFEPRDREMIALCIEDEIEFGIVWGSDDDFQQIGCAGRVAELLTRFPDGRMNIVAVGTSRFRVLERLDTHAYISARVEPYEDSTEDVDPELGDRVLGHYREALKLSLGWYRPDQSQDVNYHDLSFEVAGNMQLSQAEQQTILEMRSTNERLLAEEELLEVTLKSLRARSRSFGGNGHISPN